MRLCLSLLALVLDEGFSDEIAAMRGKGAPGHTERIKFRPSEEVVDAGESHRRLLNKRSQDPSPRRLQGGAEECRQFDQTELQQRGPQIVTIEIQKAQTLPKLARVIGLINTDTPDAYILYYLKVGGATYFARTSVVESREPAWGFSCQYPVPEATENITIDGEVWDDVNVGSDARIGTFKLQVRNNEYISGPDGEVTLENCAECDSDEVVKVAVKATWGTTNSPGGENSTTQGSSGGFPWFWVILCILIVLALVGGGIAYVLFGSGTEAQKTEAGNQLVETEMAGHFHHHPPVPPQQQEMWPPPPLPPQPTMSGGDMTVADIQVYVSNGRVTNNDDFGVSGPGGYH